MKELPKSIIWKSVKIRFINGWSQKINTISEVKWNQVMDFLWNIYHLNLEKIWSIFEPKSQNYKFKDLDDFGDLEKF